MVKQIKSKLTFFLFLFYLNIFGGGDLALFLDKKNLFSVNKKTFYNQLDKKKYNYEWTDNNHTSLRSYRTVNGYLGYKVTESVINFSQNKINDVELYFYSRGEHGVISEKNYNKITNGLVANITKSLNNKRPKSKKTRDGLESYTWVSPYRQYVLIAKKTYVKPRVWNQQYIKLSIFKSGAKQRKKQNIFNVKDNIVKAKNGDTYLINVPMVDQGSKGYCVCATMARVLQYYGRQGDQYQIAELANTSNAGTTFKELESTLKTISHKKKILLTKVKISSFPIVQNQSMKDLKKFLKVYNRYAKKPLSTEDYSINRIFVKLSENENAFSSTRVKLGGGNYQSFTGSIEKSIKKGAPVSWTVFLGFIKEKEIPQSFGGHMRLIIGYNSKSKEIIYTDSWGKGHEFKRLPYEKAYSMTTGLYLLTL